MRFLYAVPRFIAKKPISIHPSFKVKSSREPGTGMKTLITDIVSIVDPDMKNQYASSVYPKSRPVSKNSAVFTSSVFVISTRREPTSFFLYKLSL